MNKPAPARVVNTTPIDQAKRADLRGSWAALQRAARRARELAAQTGTELVVSKNGVIERIKPQADTASYRVQEVSAPYKNTP